MTIEGEDFTFTALGDSLPLFDVDLITTINKGKKNERSEKKNVAYGVPLSKAIKILLHYRVKKKCKDEVITLKEYLKLYRESLDEIKDLCLEK